ncbi:MAG TPA: hypothetical protein VFB22_13605 [Candidatus Baltobacteraceae bacterium]|nr:hypothetical protein [Candidatus Baltobacteraceae bacterium]
MSEGQARFMSVCFAITAVGNSITALALPTTVTIASAYVTVGIFILWWFWRRHHVVK